MKEINERVIKWNDYRKLKYNKPPEDTESIYLIFREVKEGQVPSTLYVGKTKQELSVRLAQHIAEVDKARKGKIEWSLKLRWLYQTMQEKHTIKIAKLCDVPKSKAFEVEAEWITYLNMAGLTLLNGDNSKYYNKVI